LLGWIHCTLHKTSWMTAGTAKTNGSEQPTYNILAASYHDTLITRICTTVN
jgi:hypothetical protein